MPYMWASGRTEYAWTQLGTASKVSLNSYASDKFDLTPIAGRRQHRPLSTGSRGQLPQSGRGALSFRSQMGKPGEAGDWSSSLVVFGALATRLRLRQRPHHLVQVEADWLIGLEHHFSTSFHEDQCKTAEPANIDDDDLTDEAPIQSKPIDVYTVRSSRVANLPLLLTTSRRT